MLSASLFIAENTTVHYPMDTGIHRTKPPSQVNQVYTPDFLGYGTNSYYNTGQSKLSFQPNTFRLPDTSCLSDYKSVGPLLHPKQLIFGCLQLSDLLEHLRFVLSLLMSLHIHNFYDFHVHEFLLLCHWLF